MSQSSTIVAGIDTGKDFLDVALEPGGEPFRVRNDASGWGEAIARLRGAGVDRVGLEASGGYERGALAALQQAGLRTVLHQPMQVRLFAKKQLQRAKNDRLDARVIAGFTVLVHPERLPADPRLQALGDHLVYVEQIGEDIARLKTRLEHQHDPRLAQQIAADIASLKQRQTAERRHLVAGLRQDPGLARRLDLVLSIPGIGLPTALALVIQMPELGAISREQAAALVGLAPFDHDSGKHKGQRHIAGGRAHPRKALFAAALPAAYQWNPQLIALYRRLLAKGKAHKQALIACARKLLIFANTVLARNTPGQTQI
jgi:transposase